jgi:hypothetical protein
MLTKKREQTRTTLRTVRIPQELDNALETISKEVLQVILIVTPRTVLMSPYICGISFVNIAIEIIIPGVLFYH